MEQLTDACNISLPQSEAVASDAGFDVSRVWLPELVQRFASFLSGNIIASTLRLVNKATAGLFNSPQDRVVHLGQPTPYHAFVHHWGNPYNIRSLTTSQRHHLLCLTARSGSILNLEVLLARADYFLPLRHDVLVAAAEAGHLDVCCWLRQRGCPWSGDTLKAAAGAGRREVCEWLLTEGCPWSDTAPAQAAHGGHVDLMQWLLQQQPGAVDACSLVVGAAEGCDLAELQRLHAEWLGNQGLQSWFEGPCLDYAASSPTADWQAKVEWFQDRGYDWESYSIKHIQRRQNWQDRLTWLLQKGYPLERLNAMAIGSARDGDTEGLQHLLDVGYRPSDDDAVAALLGAVDGGHVPAAEVVLPYVASIDGVLLATTAARKGRLPVLEWLLMRLRPAQALTVDTFRLAPESGSVELLAWICERGCPWDARAFTTAASAGSEQQLEWLAQQGCPMADDGEPYVRAASNGDVATLRCLKRLGCPWSQDIDVFTRAVRVMTFDRRPCGTSALRWLLEQGCRVDWEAAIEAAQYWEGLRPDVQEVVEELRHQFKGLGS